VARSADYDVGSRFKSKKCHIIFHDNGYGIK
jgi:hypothetical protein